MSQHSGEYRYRMIDGIRAPQRWWFFAVTCYFSMRCTQFGRPASVLLLLLSSHALHSAIRWQSNRLPHPLHLQHSFVYIIQPTIRLLIHWIAVQFGVHTSLFCLHKTVTPIRTLSIFRTGSSVWLEHFLTFRICSSGDRLAKEANAFINDRWVQCVTVSRSVVISRLRSKIIMQKICLRFSYQRETIQILSVWPDRRVPATHATVRR